MGEALDVTAMVARFRERAEAVRKRGVPPLEGPARKTFMDQARLDYQDFAMLGDAEAELIDGILHLKVDLNPSD